MRFCYRCFRNVAINFIIRATSAGGAYRYRCQICFVKMRTRAAIYQHCAQKHILKEYVHLRYPFQEGEIAVITSGDEDMYNKYVDPRNLPLRPGILLPREYQPVDSNTPSGLEWYTAVREPSTRGAGSPPAVRFAYNHQEDEEGPGARLPVMPQGGLLHGLWQRLDGSGLERSQMRSHPVPDADID